MYLKALVAGYFRSSEIKKVKKLSSVPSMLALPGAVEMLDIELVRRILEAQGPNRSPVKPKELRRCIESLIDRICIPFFVPGLPYLLGDNLRRALDLLKLLLSKYDDPAVGDYRYPGGKFASGIEIIDKLLVQSVNELLILIVADDRSEAALESIMQTLIKFAVSIFQPARVQENSSPLNEPQADPLTSEMGAEGALIAATTQPVRQQNPQNVADDIHASMKTANHVMIFLFNAVTTHFGSDEDQSFELLNRIAQCVLHPRQVFIKAEAVFSLEVLNEDFNEAVRRLDFEAIKKTVDPRFINALIPDEAGVLRSPLCHALRARHYDLVWWLYNTDFAAVKRGYFPFLYPDWLIIEGLPRKTINYTFDVFISSLLNSFFHGAETHGSVRLFTYFAMHSDRCFDIRARYPGIFTPVAFIAEIILSSDLKNKSLLLSSESFSYMYYTHHYSLCSITLEKRPLERMRERRDYGDDVRPFVDFMRNSEARANVTLEELKIVVLYFTLFNHGTARLYGVNNQQLQDNRLHYLSNLKPLPDDLLFDLLSTQSNPEHHTYLIWKEIHDRCRENPNSALWQQVKGYYYSFTIQRNMTKVLREDIYRIQALFLYFRQSNVHFPQRHSLQVLPADVIDIIASFVNPKIKRRRVNVAPQLPLLPEPAVDLAIHRAIEKCDFSQLNNVDLMTFDTKDDRGLTPLMLCLVTLNQIKLQPTWRDEQDKIDNVMAIFDFCLLHADVNRRCTVLFPVKHTVRLSPLQLALCLGLRECALKLIEHNADVNQLDSNGWLPLVYCHGVYGMNQDKFYADSYYKPIQLMLAKTKEFNAESCDALSRAAHLAAKTVGGAAHTIDYNPDPIVDGKAEFRKAYSDLIKWEHQKAKEPKIYERFALKCREDFRAAVLDLRLDDMQAIYARLVAENQKYSLGTWMINSSVKSKVPGSFLDFRVNTESPSVLDEGAGEGNELELGPSIQRHGFFPAPVQREVSCSLLAHALKNGRSDIFFWLVKAGWSLVPAESWLPETNQMPEAELKQLAVLYEPICAWNKHRLDKDLYCYSALFYEVFPLLYNAAKKSNPVRTMAWPSSQKTEKPDAEMLLQNAAEFVINNPDVFDDQEVCKRVAFLIDLQPYLAYFIEAKCLRNLAIEDSSDAVKKRSQLILCFLEQNASNHVVYATVSEQQTFDNAVAKPW